MNLSEQKANIALTDNQFTTTVSETERYSRGAWDGTRLLARAVILLAMHDLGAWCRRCAAGQCHCRQVRLSAIRFLRGEEMEGVTSTLSLWSEAAGWQEEKLRQFFSEGQEGIWIPFVIKMRSPYRRARRGASAPLEATVVDLLLAYRPNKPVEIVYETEIEVPFLCAALRSGTLRSLSPGERTGGGQPDDCRVPAVR